MILWGNGKVLEEDQQTFEQKGLGFSQTHTYRQEKTLVEKVRSIGRLLEDEFGEEEEEEK